MKLFSKFREEKDGVTAIEFAIVAPVFFLIFLGIIEVGLTMFFDSTMNTALRTAARQGIPQGYENMADLRDNMDGYMGGVYVGAPQMAIRVISIAPPTVGDDGYINSGESEAELAELESISALFSDDPEAFVGSSDRFEPGLSDQSGAITVYAAKYQWGGFSGMVGRFLPDNLYAISVVRNEVFE